MDKYSISQNPGGAKSGKGKTSKANARKDAKTLNPKLVLGGLLVGIVLVFAGVAWARHLSSKPTEPATGSAPKVTPSSAGKGVITTASFNTVTAAIEGKDLSALRSQYAKQVRIVVTRTGVRRTVGPGGVEGLIGDPLDATRTPWVWHVPADQLSAWQQGPYGQYFTGNVLVGISADGTVISVGIDSNGQVDIIFVAPVGDLIAPPSTGGGGSTSGGSGSTTTTPTQPAPSVGPNDAD